MSGRYPINAFSSLFALAVAMGSSPALAQDAVAETPAEAAAPAEEPAADTGEIVVTAQKRAENVQDVPISIAAFSGETLEENNVVNLEGLTKVTPNLSVAKGAQTSYVRLAIRGIGAASNTTVEPSVAVFLDGAYVPRVGAVISSLLDMESVEVLRGPQGTLFGRNASVGAVSFHTARPKLGDFGGEATGEIGNGDRYKASGYINVPVGDKAAFRFAGSQQWFKGYWRNDLNGEQVGGTDDTILRGSFRGEVGPVEWIFRADYARLQGDGATNIDFDRSSVSDAQWAFFSTVLGAPDTDLDDRKLNQFLTADVDDKQWGVNSTLSWDVGGGSTIRLINNYRDWENEQLDGDVIFTPTPILSRTGLFDSRSQNHELQFISPTRQWLDGRLDLVAGLYYFHEKYEQGERLHMNSKFCTIAPAPAKPLCNAFLAANQGHVENATIQNVRQTVDSYAAYAQANVIFTDQLFATLGGRFSKDSKEGSYEQLTNPLLANVRAAEALTLPDVDDEKFTYRLGLNYEPTEDLLFFGSYSTGYKSAGYNSGAGAPSLTTVGGVFRPETARLRPGDDGKLGAGRKDQLARPQADAEPHLLPDEYRRLSGSCVRRNQLHRSQCRQPAASGLRVRRRRQAAAQPVALREHCLSGLGIHRLSERRRLAGLRPQRRRRHSACLCVGRPWSDAGSGRQGRDLRAQVERTCRLRLERRHRLERIEL